MSTPRTPAARFPSGRSPVGVAAWMSLLVVLVLLTWPARFGGWTTFSIVQGSSMEPTYHSGDMLYVRAPDGLLITDYEVGDAALYRIPEGEAGTGSHVVHRIVGLDGDAFVFRGDNRTTDDAQRPRASDLAGRPVANLGPWPTRLLGLAPFLLAAAFGVAVAWFLWPEPPRSRDDARLEPRPADL